MFYIFNFIYIVQNVVKRIHTEFKQRFLDHFFQANVFWLGATKKTHFFLTVENFSKSYFGKCPKYSKTKVPEILEVIILQNLSKINIFPDMT